MGAFWAQTPGTSNWVMDIVGFTGHDTYAVGLDTRPANGLIYVVANAGGIYTADQWRLTKVGQLGVTLSGQSFGVDFNPVADRLRIISNTGQNLAHDVDGNVTTAQTALTDAATGKAASGVTAAAYTNNDNNAATNTLLFDVDTIANQISLQNPPAAGTLFPQPARRRPGTEREPGRLQHAQQRPGRDEHRVRRDHQPDHEPQHALHRGSALRLRHDGRQLPVGAAVRLDHLLAVALQSPRTTQGPPPNGRVAGLVLSEDHAARFVGRPWWLVWARRLFRFPLLAICAK